VEIGPLGVALLDGDGEAAGLELQVDELAAWLELQVDELTAWLELQVDELAAGLDDGETLALGVQVEELDGTALDVVE
jgi:hypothetical protein